MLLDAVGSPAVALAWARRAEQVLAKVATTRAAVLDIALGLCLFPDQADSAQQVIVTASAASAQARQERGLERSRSAIYDPQRAEDRRQQTRDATQFAAVLEHGGLELRLQGRAYVRGGALSAAQVELAWPRRRSDHREEIAGDAAGAGAGPKAHAQRGATMPMSLRTDGTERRRSRDGKGCRGLALEQLAEQAGLSQAFGQALLARSCLQLTWWLRQGMAVPPLSMRLPRSTLCRADFAAELTQTLRRHQLNGRHLRLELGSAALHALQGQAGHQLADAGVELVADVADVDLATLAACKRLPLASLAVDLATLGDITPADGAARATLSSLLTLAHSLGLRLLVKSVDHGEELELLQRLGCDEYQGATLAKPLPARTWTTLLSESASNPLLDVTPPPVLADQR
ncbi:MAG: hypothetical protein RIQ60_766 [Pseudomonadota bacterium]